MTDPAFFKDDVGHTLLIMSPVGVPLYSARGLTQDLQPAEEAKPAPRRTINGELRWIGLTQMRKYQSSITCTDQNAPALEGFWPGMVVLVDCVCELAFLTSRGSAERPMVLGSDRTTEDGFTYYRPQISFMVTDLSESTAEYLHDYQWKLSLAEV